MRHFPIQVGEPAPWFKCRSEVNDQFSFDSVAGRYVVLGFYGSALGTVGKALNQAILQHRQLFDDVNLCYFGVSNDADDERLGRVADSIPGIRYFWDFDQAVSRQYGVIEQSGNRHTIMYVLDPLLRVIAMFKPDAAPIKSTTEAQFAELFSLLHILPKISKPFIAAQQAPVLVLPYVFEPELCKALIAHYEVTGGYDSGFMRELNGKTVGQIDHQHKRRRDCEITDESLRKACMHRIHDRLAPEIHKAFQFKATRLERSIIACYDATDQGHFRAHRDNTTKGTAHRRFAVSLFLNSGEYEGGNLKFPEFGSALYQAPLGGAVVFSCGLLHEATPVTQGRRYMYLPFLYDDVAASIREQNAQYIEPDGAIDDSSRAA